MSQEEYGPERALAEACGMARVRLGGSGAENRRELVELARRYSKRKYGKGRATVLTPPAAPALSPPTRAFEPTLSGVSSAAGHDVCALFLPSFDPRSPRYGREFARDMAILCAERDWLLLLDESATALGKTGRLFGYQCLGFLPDGAFFDDGLLLGDKLAGEKNDLDLSPTKAPSERIYGRVLAALLEHYP